MRENANQNNSEYGHILSSEISNDYINGEIKLKTQNSQKTNIAQKDD